MDKCSGCQKCFSFLFSFDNIVMRKEFFFTFGTYLVSNLTLVSFEGAMLWRVMAAWPGTVAGGVRSLGPATRFLGLFVLVVYGLSWVADTQTLLGVSPGLLGPPAFFLWPLVTHVFVEIGLGGLVCSLITVRMTYPVAVCLYSKRSLQQ